MVRSARSGRDLVEAAHGWIFNIQRFCSDDGPGIRTTVFLKGCPLRCVWCHNPESQRPHSQQSYDADKCIRCNACFSACPSDLISEDRLLPPMDGCEGCADCIDACPTGAREVVGRQVSVRQLMDEVARDVPYFEESGGGVTFSGGEPLAQSSFLLDALRESRRRGLHTAVDTCGYARPQDVAAVARDAGLFLYDLKQMDDERHRVWTGVSNRLILENLQMLAGIDAEVWLRVPLIPGFNDDRESLLALAAFVRSLPKRYPVWLLPYHRLGQHKHERLGGAALLDDLSEPTAPSVTACAELLRAEGLEVHQKGKP